MAEDFSRLPSVDSVVVSTKEPWNEYTLEDGTVIRARLSLLRIRVVNDVRTEKGEPVYVFDAMPLQVTATIPDALIVKPESVVDV